MNGLQRILRMIYLLMRPLLAVWWAALDNSLIYWDVFYLRTSLWSMRQIMRNFANFILWGIFLFAIFYNIIKWGAAEKRSFKKVLPKLLFSTILIQASRFMMSALIDFSQIGVYTMGTLPLNILADRANPTGDKDDGAVGKSLDDVRFLKTHVQFSVDDTRAQNGTDATHTIFYSCNDMPEETIEDQDKNLVEVQTQYFIPCRIDGGFFVKQWEKWDGNSRSNRKAGQISERQNYGNTTKTPLISDEYCVYNGRVIQNLSTQWDDSSIINPIKVNDCRLAQLRWDGGGANMEEPDYMERFGCTKLSNFITSATGMTGPMYSLYTSIFKLWEIALTPNHKSVIEISLEFLIKLMISFALILPLFVLTVMLIMRAVILRWFIIFLPILVLAWVFEFSLWEWSASNFKLGSLLSLVFMPVIAVFAISMSLVVLTLLGNIDRIQWPNTDALSALGVQRTDTGYECNVATWKRVPECDGWGCGDLDSYCYNIFDITSLCFTQSQRQFGNGILNIMTWLTVNIFGIGLMWMVVFAVLKSTAIIWGIAGQVSKFAGDILKTAPLIPTPMGMTSAWAIQQTAANTMRIPQKRVNKQSAKMNDILNNLEWKRSSSAKSLREGIQSTTTLHATDQAQAQQKAIEILKTMPKNTSVSDYADTDIHKTMGIAAGLSATELASINSIEDAFANKKIYDKVVRGQRWGKDTNFVGHESGRVETMDAVKAGYERMASENTNFAAHTENATSAFKRYYDDDKKEVIEIGADNKIITTPLQSLVDAQKMTAFLGRVPNVAGFGHMGLNRLKTIQKIVSNSESGTYYITQWWVQSTTAPIWVSSWMLKTQDGSIESLSKTAATPLSTPPWSPPAGG